MIAAKRFPIGVLFFKLEEEKLRLLLLLPALIAEAFVFYSASGSGCRLVVAFSTSSIARIALFDLQLD
jgi:hypothetical protein